MDKTSILCKEEKKCQSSLLLSPKETLCMSEPVNTGRMRTLQIPTAIDILSNLSLKVSSQILKNIWDLRCSSMVEFIQDCGFDSYLRSKKQTNKKKPLRWKPQGVGYTPGEALSEKHPDCRKSEKPIIRPGMGFCIPTLAP